MTPETRRLERIRDRLLRALKHERAKHLREAVAELTSDIEAMLEGRAVADELCAETLRSRSLYELERIPTLPCPPPDFWDIDPTGCAPPTPVTMAPSRTPDFGSI